MPCAEAVRVVSTLFYVLSVLAGDTIPAVGTSERSLAWRRGVRRTEVATLATAGIVAMTALLPSAPSADRGILLGIASALVVYWMVWFRLLPQSLFGAWHFTVGSAIAFAHGLVLLALTGRSTSEYFPYYLLPILATAFGLELRATLIIGTASLGGYVLLFAADLASAGPAADLQLGAVRTIALAIVVVFVVLIVRALEAARATLRARSAELGSATQEIEAVLRTAHSGVISMDRSGRITRWNEQAAAIFGRHSREVLGRAMAEWLIAPPSREAFRAALDAAGEAGGGTAGRAVALDGVRADGSTFPLELTVSGYAGPAGWAYTAFVNDVTERLAAEKELNQRAFYDQLTGLPNRALLYDRLSQIVARAERERLPACVLMIDLDGLKTVNDTRGHDFGDRVLAAFATRLRDTVRESDTAGRLGGDEFLALLPGTATEGACSVAAKLLHLSEQPLRIYGEAVAIRPSIGISCFPDEARDPLALLEAADRAMYEAKRARSGFFVAGWQAGPGPAPAAPA